MSLRGTEPEGSLAGQQAPGGGWNLSWAGRTIEHMFDTTTRDDDPRVDAAAHSQVDPVWMTRAELPEAYLALRREITRLQARAGRILSEIDRQQVYADDDHLSATSWLVDRAGDPPAVARSRLRTARRLRQMPSVATAFDAGDLPEPRVRMLVEAFDTDPVAFARDEEVLVDLALTMSSRDLPRAIRYWQQAADADAFQRDADRAHQRRSLHVSQTFHGMGRLDGTLDPEGTEVVITALDAMTSAGQRSADDGRTPAQRRADALVDICRRALDAGEVPPTGVERPHLTVTLDLATLEARAGRRCELDHAGVITPEAARRLACDAGVSRVITAGESEPLDIGRRTRTVPAALRRALVLRDRGCAFGGCGRPHQWCDAHHLVHWADGGETTLDNLILLCRRHHRAVHEGGGPPRARAPADTP